MAELRTKQDEDAGLRLSSPVGDVDRDALDAALSELTGALAELSGREDLALDDLAGPLDTPLARLRAAIGPI